LKLAHVRRVFAYEPLEAVLHAEHAEAFVDGLDSGGRDNCVDAGRGAAADYDCQNVLVCHEPVMRPFTLLLTKRGFYRSAPFNQIGSADALQVLLRERRARRLGLPEDAHDPPAFAVVHELYTVDAAREGNGVVGLVATV